MTETIVKKPLTQDLDTVRAQLTRIAQHATRQAVTNERERQDLGGLVRDALAAGVGRLRVPREFGGVGATVVELADVLVELAAAESNLVQILRGHLGFIELLRLRQDEPGAIAHLEAAGRGEFFGPAASTPPPTTGQEGRDLTRGVRLHRDGAGLKLTGKKYYSTGSLYADWINVLVPDADGAAEVVVSRHDSAVRIEEDWNGFGQRLTASGTAIFDEVPVREELIIRHDDIAKAYLGAFYQFVHSATQAGIIKRAADDAADAVRSRRRSSPLAADAEPRRDPQVLAEVGEVVSRAFASAAAVNQVAASLDKIDSRSPADAALERAVLDSAAAQVTNTRLAGEATWLLFEGTGASVLNAELALDRHWRNARTVSSHNPAIFKARVLGDHAVNGLLPEN
ncbi:MAG: monooxygenase [Gulosibacter sp.]|uniref:monooxygenase n=1 Tax=Gulosibacter sp. TaxID=2817531 RepID=UPI003F8FF3FF